MANVISGLTKDDPAKKHTMPSGPRVKFDMGRGIRGNNSVRKQVIPVSINGHREWVELGGRNQALPEEYVQVLEQSKSSVDVVDQDQYDPERGGVPRNQKKFNEPAMRTEDLSDYEVFRR